MTDKSNLILDLTKAYNDHRCEDYKESIECVLDILESQNGEYIKKEDLFNKTIKRNSIWNEITNAEGKGLEEIVNNLPTYSFLNSDNDVISVHDCIYGNGAYEEWGNDTINNKGVNNESVKV